MILRQILVVDDNAGVRDAMDRILEDLGYLPFPAANRAEALRMLASVDFAAAVIDYALGEDNAGEVMKALREHIPDLRVVVMSGKAPPDRIAELVLHGANGYLKKPFSRDDLGAALARVLS